MIFLEITLHHTETARFCYPNSKMTASFFRKSFSIKMSGMCRLTIFSVLAGTVPVFKALSRSVNLKSRFFCIQSASIATPTLRPNLNVRFGKQKRLKTKSSPMIMAGFTNRLGRLKPRVSTTRGLEIRFRSL